MENEKKLEARPPEVKRLRCDVLVLGGGLPGVCAAIEAARGGLDVILAERSLTLGGNCGPEIGVHPSDGHRFHPYMATTGVVGRLIEEAAFRNAKTNSHGRHYNISVQFDRVLQEALDEAGVRVLRSTYAHTPYLDGARIAAVECEDTLTYERVCIEVEQFVIDDTGDGNVSERAGAGYRMGREARAEFGERMAPETADGVTMGSSLVTLLCRTGSETRFVPGKGVPPFHPGYGGEARFRPQDGENVYFWFPTETGGDVDTIRDGHLIYDRLRGHLDSAWDRCKNRLDADVTGEWEMIWVSAKVGKRESRRFIGDYTVTESDVENGTMFEDAIAAGGFAVDVHDPQKDDPAYVSVTYYLIPPTYTIPYRSIYSRDIDNLFFASRLLSATHLAHGSIRLQRTLAAVGQAAGAAAVLCAERGLSPRRLYTEGHVGELQQRLLRGDGTIPNRRNGDERDLARRACVGASSELRYGVSGPSEFERIGPAAGAQLWDFTDRVDTVSVVLRNPGGQKARVRATLSRYAPEHPWTCRDENPFLDYYDEHNEAEWGSDNRSKRFRELARDEKTLDAGFAGSVPFRFGVSLPPKDKMTDDDRLNLVLEVLEGEAEIARCAGLYPFVRFIGGKETDRNGDEAYTVGPGAPLYRLEPAPLYGEAALVLNGENRRFSENPQNMWRPAALPATLTLSWDGGIRAREARITFDTLERVFTQMPYENGRRASPQGVKRYSVSLFDGETEVWSLARDEVYHRAESVPLPDVPFDRLTLTLLETWDETRLPGVYEIRVY